MANTNSPSSVDIESFVVSGRLYRWREGARGRTATLPIAPRPTLRAHFLGSVVAAAEQRGARGRIYAAKTPADVASRDVRWVAWRVPGESTTSWGLYLVGARLAGGDAANDAFALIAWGEGQTLVWADERDVPRRVLRSALHVPPPWLATGIRSSDPTFLVRVDLLRRSSRSVAQMPLALSSPARPAAPPPTPAPAALLIGILQSWRKAHPPANDARPVSSSR